MKIDSFSPAELALAGFYLGHRETHDLDLFAIEDILDDGAALIGEIARQFEASLESIQTAPDFRRFLLRRGSEAVVIDLVRDRVTQQYADKTLVHGILLDPPQEILANKLCALLSRSELRDLVDVLGLENARYRVEDAIPAAMAKDGGLTPAQLAWVLNQIQITDDSILPAGISPGELRQYVVDLIGRLTRLAFPK